MNLLSQSQCLEWCKQASFSFQMQNLWIAYAALAGLGMWMLVRKVTMIRLRFENPKTLERVENFLAFASFLLMTGFVLLQVWK